MGSPTKLKQLADSQITQNMDLSSDKKIGLKDRPVGNPDLDGNDQVPRETLTAALQVVGAFFLMFNSWYGSVPSCLLY
jgi:hypothetical protein